MSQVSNDIQNSNPLSAFSYNKTHLLKHFAVRHPGGMAKRDGIPG